MADKRKLHRRHLIYYLKAYDRDDHRLLGHMADITVEGLLLVSEEPLQVDRDYRIRMNLPESFSSTEYIEFEARCLWSQNSVNPSLYDSGLKLLNIKDEDRKAIENLVLRFGFRD